MMCCPPLAIRLAVITALTGIGQTAAVEVPLVSYEPSETWLTVQANAGDAGLTVTLLEGGVAGAPAATDGDYLLRVDVDGESDRKVEFRHFWSGATYDLAGFDQVLADVYVETPGALPGLMGIWTPDWDPPSAWEQATGIPTATGEWTTIAFDVSDREQIDLAQIWAFVLEDLAGTTGVAYVDNLRLTALSSTPAPANPAAIGYDGYNLLTWHPVSAVGLEGYNVYSALAPTGPFTLLTPAPVADSEFADVLPLGDAARRYYEVTAVANGDESDSASQVSAQYNGLTDDELLDTIQAATFRYFWDGAHPVSKIGLEGINMGHSTNTVTTGGTGFGLASLVVAVERGWITRADAAAHILTMLAFLEDVTPRYHGAWSHHYNGTTGATIAFAGYKDNGGDLVETAFLIQGILVAREYFDDLNDAVEIELRERATRLWEGVEWDWYRQYAGSDVLYWHWSPDYGWDLNHAIRGYNEAQMVYLLAVASPTHPMPPTSYYNGWAGGSYANGGTFYGHTIWVGSDFGGPMFFTHYSNIGFDPRYKRDVYANYFLNARNIALTHHDHCTENPNEHAGYSAFAWGLTASFNPWGYSAHSPTNDNGTLTPTAALSSMPYTPAESLQAARYFYDTHGASLWAGYGFKDAFNPGASWTAPGYIAIDQGPITPMIENYRTGLIWRLFMQVPEIQAMMPTIAMYYEVDFDQSGTVDFADWQVFAGCLFGPETPNGGCFIGNFADSDVDKDGDADMHDFSVLQMLINAP